MKGAINKLRKSTSLSFTVNLAFSFLQVQSFILLAFVHLLFSRIHRD
jgi:hypothetical protein